jgi:hypothetical protein
LRIIVIECCSAGGFPIEEESENLFLSVIALKFPTYAYMALASLLLREAPPPRQVAHSGPNSIEMSSSDGETQCNGDHFFIMGEDLSKRILVATHLVQLTQNNVLETYYF